MNGSQNKEMEQEVVVHNMNMSSDEHETEFETETTVSNNNRRHDSEDDESEESIICGTCTDTGINSQRSQSSIPIQPLHENTSSSIHGSNEQSSNESKHGNVNTGHEQNENDNNDNSKHQGQTQENKDGKDGKDGKDEKVQKDGNANIDLKRIPSPPPTKREIGLLDYHSHNGDQIQHQEYNDLVYNTLSSSLSSSSIMQNQHIQRHHDDVLMKNKVFHHQHQHQQRSESRQLQQHEYPSLPFSPFPQDRIQHQQQAKEVPSSSSSSPLATSNNVIATSRTTATATKLDQFFYNQQQPKVKYYRIIYRGFVALLNSPHLQSKKSGSYVSYGEIIASTHEMDLRIPLTTTSNSIIADSAESIAHSNKSEVDNYTSVDTENINQYGKNILSPSKRNNNHNHHRNHHHVIIKSTGISEANDVGINSNNGGGGGGGGGGSSFITRTTSSASSITSSSLPIVPSTSFGTQQHHQHQHNRLYYHNDNQHYSYLSSPSRQRAQSTMSQIIKDKNNHYFDNHYNDESADYTLTTSPSSSHTTTTTAARKGSQHQYQKQRNTFSNSNNNSNTYTTIRIIQIDDVLTGGYALDALAKGTSHTHNTPRRSNGAGRNGAVGGVPNCTTTQSVSSADNNNYKNNNCNNSMNYIATTSATSTVSSEGNGSNSSSRNVYNIIPGGIDKGGFMGQGKIINDVDSIGSSEKQQRNHHGYLCESRNGIQIAECIPSPPLLCQPGPFYYRVVSLFPLPILAGPCADAPTTRAMALPGTVHEISLRMGSVHGCGGYVNNHSSHSNSPGVVDNTGLEDGIVYLRLSHRRGWIADRRYIMLPTTPSCDDRSQSSQPPSSFSRQSPNMNKGHRRNGSGGSYSLPSRRTCIELVMKEVSDYVDVSNFGINDDISLGGTSISSASIATPASVIRLRRRPIRRRNERVTRKGGQNEHDSRSGMVVLPKARRKGKNHCGKSGGDHSGMDRNGLCVMSSLMPDVSPNCFSDLSNKDSIIHESIPVHNSGSTSPLQMNTNGRKQELKPNIFLLRVTAPNGLKILDAPHFLVNNLIRGQTSALAMPFMKAHNNKTPSDTPVAKSVTTTSTMNPSSIFHTMHGSFHGGAHSWELDASGKKRILPRGVLFEASNRIERTGTFSHGSGLIKLADGTGWAIVPNKEELLEQFISYQGSVGGEGTKNIYETEFSKGYEEVGNAIVLKGNQPSSKDQLCDDFETSWVRVVQGTGVLVSCIPTSPHQDSLYNKEHSPVFTAYSSESSRGSRNGSKQIDSDASSAVGSVFGAFTRPPKKSEARLDNTSLVGIDSKTELKKKKKLNMIPCGTCIQVDPFISSTSHSERQSFVRLFGGQGWIPRSFHGCLYSIDIHSPDIRQGSFWFRVQSIDGMTVRTGPSKRARPYKSSSDGTCFRFECGEFLRAMQVLTIHGHADVEEKEDDSEPITNPSESFAKLYRNRSGKQQSNEKKEMFASLTSYTEPGEWVHVHCNGNLYLEECVNPPTIQRKRDGWRYEVVHESGVEIRKGPSDLAQSTGSTLQYNTSILVNEEVIADGENISWLRLKNGRGFIKNIGENGELLVERKPDRKGENKESSYKLISRLFNPPESSHTKK